jgi:hypothetical protein
MASIYACLGYKRKEAYLLREVLGCVMDLIVCGREEDGITKVSGPPNAGLGIENGITTPTSPLAYLDQGSVGVRMSESSSGNDSVLRLLKQVCKTIGINLDAVKLVEVSAPVAELEAGAFDDGLESEHPDTYGWSELQVGVVREAVAVAEALPGKLRDILFDSHSLMQARFPCCRPVCFIIFKDSAVSAFPRRSTSPIFDFYACHHDGSSTRRLQIRRVLVRTTAG